MSTEQDQLYLLSLTRSRVMVLSLMILVSFTLIFFAGLAIGVNVSSQVNENEISQGEQGDGAFVSYENIYKTDAVEKPTEVKGNSEVDFTQVQMPSSSAMLSSDVRVNEPRLVKTEARSESATPGENKYFIQLFVTSDVKKAEYHRAELLKRKYKGYIKVLPKEGKKLYAVRVGYYEERQLAEKHLAVLIKHGGFKGAYLVAVPLKGPENA